MPNSSPILKSELVEPLSLNPSISRSTLITIQKSDSDEDILTAPALTEECISELGFVTMYPFEM